MANSTPRHPHLHCGRQPEAESCVLIEDIRVCSKGLERFARWVEDDLLRLEQRFDSYCTRRSRKTALGR